MLRSLEIGRSGLRGEGKPWRPDLLPENWAMVMVMNTQFGPPVVRCGRPSPG